MANIKIVDDERVRAIRIHIGGGFGSWDDRPSQAEMMALLDEVIDRRARGGESNVKTEAQLHLETIDRMAAEIQSPTRNVEEWRQRCYRNESDDLDAVRQSMQAEITKRDEAISRKDTLIAQMAVDDDAARTNSIAAHRRIAELQSRLSAANDQLEQSQGIIARRNTSIDALAKEADEAKKQIDELTAKSERKTKYIGTLKAKHAELALQLRLDLDNMTESNRGHVIALKRAKAKLSGLAPLVESEISDFFAGIGSPGEPETPEVMQAQLSARILNAIAGD